MLFVNLLLISSLPFFGRSYDFSDEGKLRTTLFKDYVSKALPTVRSAEPVHTKVQLNLHSVYDLDIKKPKLSSTVHIFVTWKDDTLQWNETVYNRLNMVLLSLSVIWKPDIVLINSMEAKIIFQSNDEVLLDSKGTVTWSAYLNLDTYCPIYTTLYPFDKQTCDLVFSKVTDIIIFVTTTQTLLLKVMYHMANGTS
ncbi:unnamed protein product [Mytilus coruscus]|uniref:Neurotransmitter-gated ion-channel ligand-binding domain-containing protein n=1 Tax=Mytilus coruscus TaxID=42192 RepID=A0A6J8BKW6_MYTCO|nr:unnamed protein product [Mytilus coruscus]